MNNPLGPQYGVSMPVFGGNQFQGGLRMSEERPKCVERVWDGRKHVKCSRDGTSGKGKLWCWQHEPEARKERDDKRYQDHVRRENRRKAARAAPGLRIKELEEALAEIRACSGIVCDVFKYECDHPACEASHAAWTIADRILQPMIYGDDKESTE